MGEIVYVSPVGRPDIVFQAELVKDLNNPSIPPTIICGGTNRENKCPWAQRFKSAQTCLVEPVDGSEGTIFLCGTPYDPSE